MGDFVPTVTRDSNGFLTLDWPTNQRSETMVAREVMVQMVDDLNRLRAELEQARLNLQHARTGKALLELEQERARTADLRNAFAELAELCQRLLTERFNDMTEGARGTPTPTLPATDTTAR